jgi:septum formation protein
VSLRIPFSVLPADVAEHVEPGELPPAYLERIVRRKLDAVCDRARSSGLDAPAILVADTIVVLGSAILGKPRDVEHAAELLTALTGRIHVVFTRFAVRRSDGTVRERTVETRVTLRPASPGEIQRYAASGEGLDKAGAYAAQGLGQFLVERVEGSYTNVVGLPAAEVVLELLELGLLVNYP